MTALTPVPLDPRLLQQEVIVEEPEDEGSTTRAESVHRVPALPAPALGRLPQIPRHPIRPALRSEPPKESLAPENSRRTRPLQRQRADRRDSRLEARALRRERKIKKKKVYRCKVCDVFTDSLKSLRDHKQSRKHLNKASQPPKHDLYCSVCTQQFESKSHLERHQRGRRHLAAVSRSNRRQH